MNPYTRRKKKLRHRQRRLKCSRRFYWQPDELRKLDAPSDLDQFFSKNMGWPPEGHIRIHNGLEWCDVPAVPGDAVNPHDLPSPAYMAEQLAEIVNDRSITLQYLEAVRKVQGIEPFSIKFDLLNPDFVWEMVARRPAGTA